MAHHRYQTEAIILGNVPRGESNRAFFLFTKELGLISAHAQSVRKLSSKLQFSLSDFGYADIDLIRGQDIWRIVDAEERTPLYFQEKMEHMRVFARAARLMRRLVHGERKDEVLFSELCQFRTFLAQEELSPDERRGAEIVMAIKILVHLGYGGDDTTAHISEEPFSRALFSEASARSRALISFINARLKESHL